MLEMSKRGKILQGPLWAVAAVRKADWGNFIFSVIMAVYLPYRRLRASTSKIDLDWRVVLDCSLHKTCIKRTDQLARPDEKLRTRYLVTSYLLSGYHSLKGDNNND